MKGDGGMCQEASRRFTSSSSVSRPRSARRSAATVVTGLLMDADWKSVAVSTGTVPPASRTPYARAHSIRPPSITATLTPGTR